MYEARITNKYNFGHKTLYGDSLNEIKEKLKDYLIDTGATVKVYETKEVQIDSSWYERWDSSRYDYNESWGSKLLYEDACISRFHVKNKC